MVSEGLAIDDSRPSPEIPRQRPQIEPLIPFPGITRDNAHAVAAYVFREALLRRMSDIQTAEIHSYCQGNASFQPAGNGLHRKPQCFPKNWEDGCRGRNDKPLYACQQRIKQVFQTGTGYRFSKIPTLYRYWQAGYTIVLVAYRRLQESTRESVQFREF